MQREFPGCLKSSKMHAGPWNSACSDGLVIEEPTASLSAGNFGAYCHGNPRALRLRENVRPRRRAGVRNNYLFVRNNYRRGGSSSCERPRSQIFSTAASPMPRRSRASAVATIKLADTLRSFPRWRVGRKPYSQAMIATATAMLKSRHLLGLLPGPLRCTPSGGALTIVMRAASTRFLPSDGLHGCSGARTASACFLCLHGCFGSRTGVSKC